MPRIAVVITARASLARVRTVLENLSGNAGVDLRLILAGGALLHHYGDTERDLDWPVSHRVYSALAGNTLQTTAAETGILTSYLSQIFREDAPDLVVTIADRHETLATAIAASYQHIPLAHIQGGEHTGSIDDKVRYAVSMLSDAHFPSTAKAAQTLNELRVRGPIFHVGCPSIDLAARAEAKPEWADHLVVLQHPVTDEVYDAAAQIDETFAAVTASEFDRTPILWLWPGQDAGSDDLAKRLREHRDHADTGGITFIRHLPAADFLSILRSARVILGNSSVGIREAGYLGTPTVNVGTRQALRERAGNVIDVGYNRYEIRSAVNRQLAHGRYPSSALYGDGGSGKRIAALLVSLCGHPITTRNTRVPSEVITLVPGEDAA